MRFAALLGHPARALDRVERELAQRRAVARLRSAADRARSRRRCSAALLGARVSQLADGEQPRLSIGMNHCGVARKITLALDRHVCG